jgi:predicted permease
LAKAVERRREIGIRLALGAGRGRLVRQLLTESVLLSTLGAALGFGLAWFAARSLSNFQLPIQLPVSLDFTPDGRVLAFTAALAVATGIVFGLAPALMATRTDLVSAIKGSETSVGVFRRFGLRNLLVGLQVTFSVVLLVAAGLFVRSLGNAASMDLGIRPDHVLLMAVDPKTAGYSTERLREFLGQLETRVTALPGVRSVAASNLLPLSMAQNSDGFREVHGKEDKRTEADIYSVTPGYFETVGIPLVRGRNFSAEKDLKNPVAIVSRTMARRMFGDQDPIGRMIRSGEANSYEIVGISGDSKSVTLGEEVKACAYTYLPRNASEEVISLLGMTILVRATGDPAALTRPVRDEILKLDPTLAVFNVDTMTRHVSRAFLIPRLCATLFGIFGLLGLTLAGVGLFGVVGYSVRSRTREIGIRMALGARPAAVVRLVLSQGLGIVGLGMAIGLGISWGLTRFTSSLLYGLSTTDVVTFTAVPLVLLATALAAVVLPARRAVTIHPMDALRLE